MALGDLIRKHCKINFDTVCNLSLVASIPTLCGILIYDQRDASETFQGFPELQQGYQVVDFQIPTKGDVVFIKNGEGARRVVAPNGDVQYEGKFYYEIRPQAKFGPQDDQHSDMQGRTPLNPDDNYWGDVRTGKVVLRR